MMPEFQSMCRICTAMCGVMVSVEEGRIASVRADRAHPYSHGFACSKGLRSPELHNDPDRIVRPLKRMEDGSFRAIPLDQALDEIAASLRQIIAEDGPDAIGMFKGTPIYQNATSARMLVDWMAALGSTNTFSTVTIDQSSHMVTAGRMGVWNAGKHEMDDADVALLVGTNPFVSMGGYGVLDYDPVKRLKAARARGFKLIVIDPRRTETAVQADCFLQPVPGEDPSILAGLIRIILENSWEDRDFCRRYVADLDALRRAVEPFTIDYVQARAGVDAAQIEAAAAMFARDAKRGIAIMGTGGAMAPKSNLADHLVETLNVICGRMRRAGERVPNPGVLSAPRRFVAEVIPSDRVWERGRKSSTGHGTIYNERMSGILASEMLLSGPGRIRALIVNAANPAVALPNQRRAVEGLKNLDLLVAVEPYMTATARLSDYVLPCKLMYERSDVAKPANLEAYLSGPAFNQYLPALVEPPSGSEIVDEWYIFWALAKRLGLSMSFAGMPLDLAGDPPSTDDLLDILFRDARIPLATVQRHPGGHLFDDHSVVVEPGDPDSPHRFEVAPSDIVAELAAVAAETDGTLNDGRYPFRLTVRRIRSTLNSMLRTSPETQKRAPQNPLYVHPADLDALGLTHGDRVSVIGETAAIPAVVAADDTMRRGVVSMTHCWGMLPGDDYMAVGVSSSQLVRTDAVVETINAMPAMTAIPVRIAASGAMASSP